MSRHRAYWLPLVVILFPVHSRADTSTVKPQLRLDPQLSSSGQRTAAVADPSAPVRGYTHLAVDDAGVTKSFATPMGLGAGDLERAYLIPDLGTQATIAIVNYYSYANVETDLAIYRAEYGLPPCMRANGCLTIANQNAQRSPLPDPPPAGGEDTSLEQMLDLEMASAGCPGCKLVLIEADAPTDANLAVAQNAAVQFHPAVISNSWGGAEALWNVPNAEPYFHHSGIATFVSTGDNGYDLGGQGPQYPASSANVIAVGGTVLTRAHDGRGWDEVTWPGSGSSCSNAVAKPSYQVVSACPRRQTADISAAAENISMYVSDPNFGGWITAYGTSAATPLMAAAFAQIGASGVTNSATATLPYLNDVVSGTNGTCGNSLCNAGLGWDGPTGFGTVNAALLLEGNGPTMVLITYPQAGDTVGRDFTLVGIDVNAQQLQIAVDDDVLGATNVSPTFSGTVTLPSALTPGQHALHAIATGPDGTVRDDSIVIDYEPSSGSGSGSDPVEPPGTPPVDTGSGGSGSGTFHVGGATTGGCAAAGGDGSGLAALAFAAAFVARRRRGGR